MIALPPDALSLILAWCSPALPVGAFSYSHGLEQLAADGDMPDAEAAHNIIADALTLGSGRTDAILLAAAHRAVSVGDETALEATRELGLALAPSAERFGETVRQGNAFVRLSDVVWHTQDLAQRGDWPLAVAFGAAGAARGVPVTPLAHGFLFAFAANLVSAAVRIVPLGQTDGQRVIARLAPVVAALAADSVARDLEDVGGAALGLDLATMRHETLEVRLFRS